MNSSKWESQHTITLPENAMNEFTSKHLHYDLIKQFVELLFDNSKNNKSMDGDILKAFDLLVSMRYLEP